MSESITPDPHDRFFKETFGRKENVVPFLQEALPIGVTEMVDWQTLVRKEATFLDETLAKRSSDLLFSVGWNGGEAFFYCLFEHQSTCDHRMPLRLLRLTRRYLKRRLQRFKTLD